MAKFVGPAADAAGDEDAEALAQAHVNAVAGACLALGIKFAGSANAAACGLLTHYCGYFQAAKARAPDASSGTPAATGPYHALPLSARACCRAWAPPVTDCCCTFRASGPERAWHASAIEPAKDACLRSRKRSFYRRTFCRTV